MEKTFRDLLSETRSQIQEVLPAELEVQLAGNSAPTLIDVREPDEVDQGQIPGARAIPRGFLELKIETEVPAREQPLVVYCAGGVRSALAAKSLQDMGYKNVRSMTGGFGRWKQEGRRFVQPRSLSAAQRARYSRHLLLPEVKEEGQLRLLEAKVLVLGAGGLGSPSAYYLAAAGVGTLGMVDDDLVDASNLQRQILHNTERVGQPKVESARATLQALNPDVRVVPHQTRLTSANADELFSQYDLIVDGCDNFPTRYLINDACLKHNKPNIHGSIFRFEGQVTTFVPRQGPCYRCLYPEPPPPEMAPSCQEAGVLGVLPGVIGVLQAIEAIKIILNKGDLLNGRLVMFDALGTTFREMKLRRDKTCPACGENAKFTGYIDYEGFCALPQSFQGGQI